jgi:hypothetical protein
MKPGRLAFVALVSLSACAVDGLDGEDDLATSEIDQDVTVTPDDCTVSVNLTNQTSNYAVNITTETLRNNGCNHAVVYAQTGGRNWLVSVDWHGTTGECWEGWLNASLSVLSNGTYTVSKRYNSPSTTTSNPLACYAPKVVWALSPNRQYRIGAQSYWRTSDYPVGSLVTFVPE